MADRKMLKLGFLAGLAVTFVGAALSTSAAWADIGPYASVLNSKGEVVAKWGAYYGEMPGTQIQLAENFAECGNSTECSKPAVTPLYPKVVLEPGVYHLLKAYGAQHAVWPKCEGIFAYSGIELTGTSVHETEIGNDITSSQPCGSSLGKLTAVLYVGQDPTNINTVGNSLKLSTFSIKSAPPSGSGPQAEYGLFANNIQGSSLSVSSIFETEAAQAGMLIGSESLPVIGTEASPVRIKANDVESSSNEGIVLEGKHMLVEENSVYETMAHGIAVYGPASEYIQIQGNSITSSSWGISLDGSGSGAIGRENSVYNNKIAGTCIGVVLYRQVDARIAGNLVEDLYTGWNPSKGSQGCPEFGHTIGAAIENGCDNGVWNNRFFYLQDGVWIYDGGNSPSSCEYRTTANYIGRVLEIGHPWPWTVSGNWIEHPEYGFKASSYASRPAAVSGNEFAGNAIDNYSIGMWWFEPGTTEITNGNT